MQDRMTATSTVIQEPCPDWCINDREGCLGEHMTDALGVPATASAAVLDGTSGAHFPAVTVSGSWSVRDGSPLAMSLHFGTLDGSGDAEVFLRLDEARQLLENAQLVLGQIEAAR